MDDAGRNGEVAHGNKNKDRSLVRFVEENDGIGNGKQV